MNDTSVRRTWEPRELVLLDAIAKAEEEDGEPLHSLNSRLRDRTGLTDQDVQLGLRALHEAGYIAGTEQRFSSRVYDLVNIRLLERGRRLVGQWPADDQYREFVAVIEQHIADAATDEDRSRLERIKDVALGVGREVLTSVLSERARRQAGL